MYLIDQQIERTAELLASSGLTKRTLTTREEVEELLFGALDEDPPNQVILLRSLGGEIIYQNRTADIFKLSLPLATAPTLAEIGGHQLRFFTYPFPRQQVILQVGLILDQRSISWEGIKWRILGFSILAVLAFVILAVLLTNYLLRPMKELALYFRFQASEGAQQVPMPSLVKESDEFRQLGEAVQTVTERWQELLSHHSSILARLIHEIRTPMTIIRNKLEFMGEKNGALESVPEILEELSHVENLTQEFMAWSKLEYSATSEPQLHAIPARAFVEGLACVKRGTENLVTNFDLGATDKFFAKPEHFRLILENLLDNAQKYGTSGKPIHLNLCAGGIEVRSYGDPVPESVLKKLGRPFNRGTELPGSTGLGLANVVSVCKKYNWSLSIHRENEENVFRLAVR